MRHNSSTWRRLLAALLGAGALTLLCWGLGWLCSPAYAQYQGPALVAQEIRYLAPAAGEVQLVWGLDGWQPLLAELRPGQTWIEQGVMHSPMERQGQTFVASVRGTPGATLDYGFRILAKHDGARIEPLWDGSMHYRATVTAERVITVTSTAQLDDALPLPSSVELGMYVLAALGLLVVSLLVIARSPALTYGGPLIARGSAARDGLFLAVIVALSLSLYVTRLGFYSDDWAFLAAFAQAPDRSLPGLFRANYSAHTLMRPAQIFYFALLYWLFGANPLGYHLVNSAVLVLCALLFYLTLRELGLPRQLCVAVPLVYALLPNYSTDRFWFAAFQAGLSMALYFLSLYADLRTLRAGPRARWLWKLLALLSLFVSGLAYEVALPLFLFNTLLVWYLGRPSAQASRPGVELPTRLLLAASSLLVLVAVLTFKGTTVARLDHERGFVERTTAIVGHAFALNPHNYDRGLNFRQALATNYGEHVVNLPVHAWHILWREPGTATLVVAASIGLLGFVYLAWIGRCSTRQLLPASQYELLRPAAWGLLLFVLGYAIFFTNTQVQFSATGIGNRTAIAAAVGVALSVVASVDWLSTLACPRAWAARLFAALLSLFCVAGFLVNNSLAGFWIEAYRQQQNVLAAISTRFPALPAGSTLLLDGVCPYAGPAIVFESHWDLAGRLQMHYHNPTLRADVVTPSMQVADDAVKTTIYNLEMSYPYNKLFIYRYGVDAVYPVGDAQAARRYFELYNPDYSSGCSRGKPGFGVPIF
jgi:hypothetical protein